MATYLPQYQHDLFVSYAHVDNEPLPGAEMGWVTNLIHGLKLLSLNLSEFVATQKPMK
jgi:hypothetical protein